jgi:hypothetical protein
MIKIATISLGHYHASEHYRIEGVFKPLADKGLIQWERLSDQDISDGCLEDYDIFFFWNPSHPKSMAYIKAAQNAGCKVWIDFDDDWENVPLYHPHTWRTNPKFQEELNRIIIKEADAVTVTTASLRELGLKYNRNTFIVPNALPNKINVIEHEPSDKQVIGWRGSDRHIEDIRAGLKALKDWDNIKFHFVGLCPWFFIDKGIPFTYSTWSNKIQEYFNQLMQVGMRYCWWPLIDNQFNQGISNNVWLEATSVGGVIITPQWLKEHMNAPNFYYKNHKQLSFILDKINSNELEQMRIDKLKASVTLINKSFVLDVVNVRRMQVAEFLMNQKKNLTKPGGDVEYLDMLSA